MLNQLARTYSAQLEAFNRYHGGTDQKVTVQNVSVAEGGQAIVGNVTQAAARAAPEEAVKAKPALTDARQVPMRSSANRSKCQLRYERTRKCLPRPIPTPNRTDAGAIGFVQDQKVGL